MQRSQDIVLSDLCNKVCHGLVAQLTVWFGLEYVC